MNEHAEPTEMAGAAEAETEMAYAWALDYDDPDEFPTQRLTPRRITSLGLAASLVTIAVAGGVAFGVLRQPEPAPAPVSVVETTTKPAPPAPPPVTATVTVLPPPPPVTVTVQPKPVPTVESKPDSDVPHACQALLHQPQTAFDGPNQAVQELERVYGLDANHAEALVDQLIVLDKDDPAGWRPSQTCFDLWHEGYIK